MAPGDQRDWDAIRSWANQLAGLFVGHFHFRAGFYPLAVDE